MLVEMDLCQAIINRSSTRSFSGGELSLAALQEIDKLAMQMPAGVRMVLLDGINGRVGTYGVVSKSTVAIAMVTDGSPRAQFQAGRWGEWAVLTLTALGFGSCWLGATFNSSELAAKAKLGRGENLAAVIVAGCRAEKTTWRDRLMRSVVRSRHRKSFDELFRMEGGEEFRTALEAVRLAPSARNLQPWRAIARKGRVDFYFVDTGRFAMLDMGIAYAHFEIACRQDIERFETADYEPFDGASYLYSATPSAGSKVGM